MAKKDTKGKKGKEEQPSEYPKWTPLFVVNKDQETKMRVFGETFREASSNMYREYLDLVARAAKTNANSTTLDYHILSMQRMQDAFSVLANVQAHFDKLESEVHAAEAKQAKKDKKSGPAPQA